MRIKAKFRCSSVTKYEEQENVILAPVTDDNEDNKKWSKWTPSGQLELTITNEACWGAFEPGKEYLLDIAPAEG